MDEILLLVCRFNVLDSSDEMGYYSYVHISIVVAIITYTL